MPLWCRILKGCLSDEWARRAFAALLIAVCAGTLTAGTARALDVTGSELLSSPRDPASTPPSDECFSHTNGNVCYKFGETIIVAVTFDEDVEVDSTATPPTLEVTLTLSNSSESVQFRYDPDHARSTGATLVFSYVVELGDADDDGISTQQINNAASISGTTSGDTLAATYILSNSVRLHNAANHAVRGERFGGGPTIETVEMISTPVAKVDTYGVGEVIAARVNFSAAITVPAGLKVVMAGLFTTSIAGMQLSCDGGSDHNKFAWREFVYDRAHSGNGASSMVFTYTVSADTEDCDDNGLVVGAEIDTSEGQRNLDEYWLGTDLKVSSSLTAGMTGVSDLAVIRGANGVSINPSFEASNFRGYDSSQHGFTGHNVDYGGKPSNLSALTVSADLDGGGNNDDLLTLTPAFNKDTDCRTSAATPCVYRTTVPHDTETVTYSATAEDSDATVAATVAIGDGTPTDLTGSDITLGGRSSETTLTITVSQGSAGTDSSYQVVIARPDRPANLSALTVSADLDGEGSNNDLLTLTPAFDMDADCTTADPPPCVYRTSVSSEITTVTYSATAADSNATIAATVAIGDGTPTDLTGTDITLGGQGTETTLTITVSQTVAEYQYVVVIAREQEGPANLSALTVSADLDGEGNNNDLLTLTPAFDMDADCTSADPPPCVYRTSVPHDIGTVTYSATAADSNATVAATVAVDGGAPTDLTGNDITLGGQGTETTLTITVSQTATEFQYVVVIARGQEGPANLRALTVDADLDGGGSNDDPLTLTPEFDADADCPVDTPCVYRASAPHAVATVTYSATAADAAATIAVTVAIDEGPPSDLTGNVLTLGSQGSETTLTITVSQITTVFRYVVVINREQEGASNLSALTVRADLDGGGSNNDLLTLTPAFDASANCAADSPCSYSTSAPHTVETVTYRATPADRNATVTATVAIDGGTPRDLSGNDITLGDPASQTTLTITVSQTTTEFRYIVVITREVEGPANLRTLTVRVDLDGTGSNDDPLTLTPSFNASANCAGDTPCVYRASVPYSVETATYSATAADSNAVVTATVVIDGGAPSALLGNDLTLGDPASETTLTITVSQTATAFRYVVVIARGREGPANLSDLRVGSDDSLSPAFDPDANCTVDVGPPCVFRTTVPYTVESVTYSATPADGNAIVTATVARGGGAPETLTGSVVTLGPPGTETTLTITVSQTTIAFRYTVIIARDASPDATMTSLLVFVDDGATALDFDIQFASGNSGPYTVRIPNIFADVQTTAMLRDSNATLTGSLQRPGGTSADVSFVVGTDDFNAELEDLAVGVNVFTITVMAQEGSIQTYVLHVDRAAALSLPGVDVMSFQLNDPIDNVVLPEAEGGFGGLTYVLESLPPGLAFLDAGRVLSGAPAEVGEYELTYRVTDSAFPQPASAEIVFRILVENSLESVEQRRRIVLPEVARAIAGQTVEAIARRATAALRGEVGTGLSGVESVRTALDLLVQGASQHQQGRFDLKSLLAANARGMAMSLAQDEGPPVSIALWGDVDRRDFSGDDRGVAWDGTLFGAYGGVDARLNDRLAIGVALSQQDSDVDYVDSMAGTMGVYDLSMRGVYPYLGWSPLPGVAEMWATAGRAEGTLNEADNGNRFRSDVRMRLYGLGGDLLLHDAGVWKLRSRSEFLHARMEVEELEDEGGVDLEIERLRQSVEGALGEMRLGYGVRFAPWAEVGMRIDMGDGRNSVSTELAGGARLTMDIEDRKLSLKGRGRYSAANDGEWGVGASLSLSAAPSGFGFSFQLQPSWGETESLVDNLWREGGVAGVSADPQSPDGHMDLNLDYGFPYDGLLVTPFMRATLKEGSAGDIYRIGGRIQPLYLRKAVLIQVEAARSSSDHTGRIALFLNW